MAEQALYRGMTQAELEHQYNARATVDDIQPFLDRYLALSIDAKASCACELNVSYGAHADETLDVFRASDAAPVFVFIHGGYWRLLSKDDSSFFASCFAAQGIASVAVNYSLAPAASLDTIVAQVRAAVAFIWQHAARFGIDRDRIYVGGSSAGGHLAAMVLADPGMPEVQLAGAVLASGLYDLEPLLHCQPNEWLQLDRAAAARNSPMQLLPKRAPNYAPRGCPLLLTWGGSETDEFKRQSVDFAASCEALAYPVTAMEVADRNHFDIVLDLADPNRELAQHVFRMILGR